MKIPETGIIAQIDEMLSQRPEKKRSYLGASQLGTECDRRIYYTFHREQPSVGPRIQRIFDMGNMIEDYLVKLLIDSGLEVWDREPETNRQYGFVDGIVKGHADGIIKGIPESDKPHLLEIKSAKNSRFNEVKKKGVRSAMPEYYTQAIVYAHKLKLDKILFLFYNKDTSELYKERLDGEPIVAQAAINRGKEIVAGELPDRAYSTRSFFKCKFCPFQDECWK